MRGFRAAAVATATLCIGALAACGGSGSQTGTLTLQLTDAPVDGVTSVIVVFTGVELKPANGNPISVDFATKKEIDLLQFQHGSATRLLDNQTVAAGQYQWMRLKVYTDPTANDASRVTLADGSVHNLVIPSGAETGLKLVRGFMVAQGSNTGFIIDFDARKSLVAPPGQAPSYFLKPALRVMDMMQVGAIAGTVHLTDLAAAQMPGAPVTDCHAGLYLFEGATATPDDFDGDLVDDGGADPIYFQPVANDGVVTDVDFSIPFVAAGASYTLAATCNFDKDAVDANDYAPNAAQGDPLYQTMSWSAVNNISVSAGATTTVSVP